MRHAVRPRAGPRRLFLVRSIRLNVPNGMGRAVPQRLACRVDATPPGREKPQRSIFCNRVEYCEVKPVSEFLQTRGPGKLRHRPNPLLPSLSQTLPTFLYATARQKTAATLHSQKDFRAPTHKAHSEFSDAVSRARAARVLWLERKLLRARKGAETTAAIFALKNADPVEWRDVKHAEHRHVVSINMLTDEQLNAIASGASLADVGVIEGDFERFKD